MEMANVDSLLVQHRGDRNPDLLNLKGWVGERRVFESVRVEW